MKIKNLVVNYDLFSDKSAKIVLLSDLHDYPFSKNKNFLDDVKSQEADLIIVDGDLLQGTKYSEKNSISELKYGIDSLAESAPVFLKRGNHDLIGSNNTSGFKSLASGKEDRVFAANNEFFDVTTKNGIDLRIVDFTPSREAYAPSGQESGLAIKVAARDFKKSGLSQNIAKKDAISIISLHDPKFWTTGLSRSKLEKLDILNDDTYDFAQWLSQFDAATGGHLHNGYIPSKLVAKNPGKYLDHGWWEMVVERDADGGISMIRPWVYKKTTDCRGAIYVGAGNVKILQVSDGKFYDISDDDKPVILSDDCALKLIDDNELKPIFISGGVNKFFGLSIDAPEITTISTRKHGR